MSTLTRKEREKLPESDFAGPDRSFPIMDQSDVDAAAHLVGRSKKGNPESIKARIKAIARRKGLKLPEAWEKDEGTSKHTEGSERASIAAFALEDGGRYVDGDYAIYPAARIFRSGVYESKGIEITPLDQRLAVEDFVPLGGNIEHTDFLAGKACEVRSLFIDQDDPELLRGEVAVPLWLDQHLGDHERKLSAEWNREDKSFAGLALCVHPHITEAALFSAFSRHVASHPELQPELIAQMSQILETHEAAVDKKLAEFANKHNTPEGQAAMQHIHDHAAKHGAVCDKNNAMFVSSHERTGMQDIHDHAVKHGAMCSGMPAGVRSGPGNAYYFSNPTQEGSAVSTENKPAAETQTPAAPTVNFAELPEYKAVLDRAAKLEEQVAAFTKAQEERQKEIDRLSALAETERRSKQAHQVAAFVKEKEFPKALHPQLCEVLAFARELDHKAGADSVATFTAAEGDSKVHFGDALESLLVKLKDAWFTQAVAMPNSLPTGHRVLPNEADPSEAIANEAKFVLSQTDLGKKYLKEHGGKIEPTVTF